MSAVLVLKFVFPSSLTTSGTHGIMLDVCELPPVCNAACLPRTLRSRDRLSSTAYSGGYPTSLCHLVEVEQPERLEGHPTISRLQTTVSDGGAFSQRCV